MPNARKTNEYPTIANLFDLLDRWRHLPNYQLERRADIFFALFLPEVLEKVLSKGNSQVEIKRPLIPEFPIRTDNDKNLSKKIDYFALSGDRERTFLIELKTDMKSIDKEQIRFLKRTAKRSLRCLIKDVLEICRASDEKAKYVHLLENLSRFGLVKHKDGEENVREVLGRLYENAAPVAPYYPNRRSEAISRGKRFAEALCRVEPARMISWPEIQPVYVQPRQCEDARQCEDQDGRVVIIDFKTFAEIVERPAIKEGGSVGIRLVFAHYLRKWAAVDAGSPNPKDWHSC